MNQQKIKILYVISSLKRCGPTLQLLNVARHLDNKLFDVQILTLSPEPDDSLQLDFLKIGARLGSLNRTERMNLSLINEYRYAVNQRQPDIIHSHGIRADFLAMLVPSRYKKVSTVHNVARHDYKLTYGSFKGSVIAEAHYMFRQFQHLNISCSTAVMNDVRRRALRTSLIYNSVPDEYFMTPLPSTRLKGENRVSIVSVGWLRKLKDPLCLINASSRLTRPSTLTLVGDGPLKAACTQAAATLPSYITAVFPGRTTDVLTFVDRADIFVSCSHSEGLPTAAIEAIARGKTLVLSDILPHQELAAIFPERVRLFPVGDSAALTEAIEGCCARETPPLTRDDERISQFRSSTMAGKHAQIYTKLVQYAL